MPIAWIHTLEYHIVPHAPTILWGRPPFTMSSSFDHHRQSRLLLERNLSRSIAFHNTWTCDECDCHSTLSKHTYFISITRLYALSTYWINLLLILRNRFLSSSNLDRLWWSNDEEMVKGGRPHRIVGAKGGQAFLLVKTFCLALHY